MVLLVAREFVLESGSGSTIKVHIYVFSDFYQGEFRKYSNYIIYTFSLRFI
jgi:hypothetical protein